MPAEHGMMPHILKSVDSTAFAQKNSFGNLGKQSFPQAKQQ